MSLDLACGALPSQSTLAPSVCCLEGSHLCFPPSLSDGAAGNSEAGRENMAATITGQPYNSFRINDIPLAGYTSYFACEWDAPPYGMNVSAKVVSEVFLRGSWLELGFHSFGSLGTT